MPRLDRIHWQLLTALRELGTISAAAQAVFISQSAASQRLLEAERRLGVPLVDRMGRSVKLNRSGERIAAAGLMLEQQFAAAEADAIWLGRNEGERLRVVQPYYDNQEWFVAFARGVAMDNLGIELELVRCGAANTLSLLANGHADVALLPHDVSYPGITSSVSFDDELVALVPPDDPLASAEIVSPSNFEDRSYLTYDYMPQSGFEFERFFRPANIYPARIIRIESSHTILSMIGAGLGVSILSRHATTEAVELGRVVRLALNGGPLRISWHLLVSLSAKTELIKEAIDRLQQYLESVNNQ